MVSIRIFYSDLIKCYIVRCLGARPLNVNIGNVEESLGCRCRTCEKLDDFLKSSERLELHAFGDSLSLNHVHLRVQLGGSQSHIKANLASGSSRQKLVIVKQQHPDDLVVQENRRRRKAEAVRFMLLIACSNRNALVAHYESLKARAQRCVYLWFTLHKGH